MASWSSRQRSCWRSWNRLSRLQRGLSFVLLFLLVLGVLLYFSDDPQSLRHGRNRVEFVHSVLDRPENKGRDDDANYDEGNNNNKNDDEGNHDFYDVPVEHPHMHDENDASNVVEDEDNNKKKLIVFNGPTNDRQNAVVNAFKHAWHAYKKYAWGSDHVRPLSKRAHDWFGLGFTIVDALDTLLIMKLDDEFDEARAWVENELDFDKNIDVNFFETTIRVLGGLLSAYHLNGEDYMFMERAEDLADRLMGAFQSPSGIPYADVNLMKSVGHAPKWSSDSSTSEVTTVQVEFRDLSRCTGDDRFEESAAQVSNLVHKLPKKDGLVPIFINANTGEFRRGSTITMGARGDSYYEYLLKQWIQTGKTLDYLKDDYLEAVEGIKKHLVRQSLPSGLTFLGEIPFSGSQSFKPKMDELACFLPGTLALGVYHGMPTSHLELSESLMHTCYETWRQQPTHLAAEITFFNFANSITSDKDFYVKPNDAHYLLRPETLESLYYLHSVTHNTTYQSWAWSIFEAIETYTKVESGGYTTIGNVRDPGNTRPKDMQESWLFSETLKYLYLIFGDEQEVKMDKWIFNTEAHLVPIRSY